MRMPAIFVGHGSPMNAIQDNAWSRTWQELGQRYTPKGIIMFSAHWYVKGLKVQKTDLLKKIDDMYGFPQALYTLRYPAQGSPKLGNAALERLGTRCEVDNSWGLDHGAWSVLVHMYPDADIPVVQVSIDRDGSPRAQFEAGQALADLREEGYMIMGSGNVVHNLRMLDPSRRQPFDWASSFDDTIERWIMNGEYGRCVDDYARLDSASAAVPMPDHYFPLLAVLGAVGPEDAARVFNKSYDLASLSMTGYVFE